MTNPDTLSAASDAIPYALDSPLVALTPAIVEEARSLVLDASNVEVVDDETFQAADALNAKIRRLGRDIEAQRKQVKAPVLDIGKKIDAACKPVMAALKEATGQVSQQVTAYQREQMRIAEEKRREAARVAAEEEKKRREAAEAAQRAMRAGEAAEAAKKLQEAAQANQRREAELQKPVEAPRAAASVRTRTVRKLLIIDPNLIPRTITHRGVQKVLLEPARAVIEALLRDGAEIPGCVLEEREVFVSK